MAFPGGPSAAARWTLCSNRDATKTHAGRTQVSIPGPPSRGQQLLCDVQSAYGQEARHPRAYCGRMYCILQVGGYIWLAEGQASWKAHLLGGNASEPRPAGQDRTRQEGPVWWRFVSTLTAGGEDVKDRLQLPLQACFRFLGKISLQRSGPFKDSNKAAPPEPGGPHSTAHWTWPPGDAPLWDSPSCLCCALGP